MVENLRKKFVTVTMVLLIATIGILFVAFYHYSSYETAVNKYQIVKWVADNDILLRGDYKNRITALEETGLNPVVGVIIDGNDTVTDIRKIGSGSTDDITQRLIDRILNNTPKSWREASFVYIKKELSDGNRLIVILNTEHRENRIYLLGSLVIFIIGIALLTFVTNDLSRFVTEPARQELEREKRFITDASHELKTPLGAISINAQALEMENGENIHIKNIVSETRRMNSLIERLLTLARLEETSTFESSEFSLSAAVEEISLTYESIAYEKHIDYKYDVQEDINGIGNEDEFKQLVAILLDNALKHTAKDERIRIRLSQDDDGILFTVKNTGEYISESDLPYIFDRFYSSDRENNKGSFGLGLSIAKAIVERMKGTISAENESDGTCFTVEL
ncbi:sensor histidine kinase [Oribacterium sp. P6A1]|uniref:sensor histidine kinase n=1 Tax=Oribacterium sp. P6A1 TaxID=1410612 RepID=UPI00056B3362|nr:HAMP domain-containing sensor histidine kinase [Oribacterium sp. P6A1]